MIHALLIAVALAAPGTPKKAPAPAPAASSDDPTVKAKELFTWGQKLYKQARYAEAISKFEEAYAVRPHPVIFYNVGKCYEQLGETAKALRSYRDYLRLSPDAPDKETVSDAVANLERRLREKGQQQLMVFADPPTARIAVDGKDLGTSPASVELVAGNHTLVVTADGFDKVERSFVMQLNRATEMTISLRQTGVKDTPPLASDVPKKDEPKVTDAGPPPPAPPVVTAPVEEKKGRVFTWVAGGVAVAGLGAGIGMALAEQGKEKEIQALQNDPKRATQLGAEAQGLATGANVAYAAAGAAAITAVVLFFLEK